MDRRIEHVSLPALALVQFHTGYQGRGMLNMAHVDEALNDLGPSPA